MPKCQISELNIIAIRDQCHANVGKQMLLAEVEVGPPNGVD